MARDRALNEPGPAPGVDRLPREESACLLAEYERDALHSEPVAKRLDVNSYDTLDVLQIEVLKMHDLIDPVKKLRAKRA